MNITIILYNNIILYLHNELLFSTYNSDDEEEDNAKDIVFEV